ncbi:MAG TPA: hypothetical protein VKT49_03370 [Bryobacteraceae bacterium]|nr:hypothetical protein [Bryobacteraceae bacterium]
MSLKLVIGRCALLFSSTALLLQATGTSNTCDLNGDGVVNAIDVQLLVNMELGATSCSANVGDVLGCSDAARQVIIKSALGQGCHFNYLNWTASPSPGVIGYNIYRGTSPGGESAAPLNTGGPVNGLSFADVNTVSGTTYYYTITATDGMNESAASEEISTTAQ